jgi:hypothetical protein
MVHIMPERMWMEGEEKMFPDHYCDNCIFFIVVIIAISWYKMD